MTKQEYIDLLYSNGIDMHDGDLMGVECNASVL